MDNMANTADNLIGNLQEALRNLQRLSDALCAIADDLGGGTPSQESIPSVEGESAIALSVLTKTYSEELLRDADHIGGMIGHRVQPPVLVPPPHPSSGPRIRP